MPSASENLLLSVMQADLLESEHLAEMTAWLQSSQADHNILAREFVSRGLLTPFQVKEIFKGRGRDLTVGPYQLLDVLGEGGMGRVYKAKQSRLGRIVALKLIRKEKLSNPQAVLRFHQEVHAAAQLSHPNVVMAFDAESGDNQLYLSMEYVEGTDLTKLVTKFGAMPVHQACDAIRQAAFGLQHAHEQGMVHRDIKPSNLLYTPRGQVKVLDLGLALLNQKEWAGGLDAGRVTQDGFVIGTPDFLAPEQAQNPGGVDIRADIYALGATLYYLLTARVPYEATTPTDKLIQHVTAPPPSLLAARPDMPPQLDAIIRWLMAKKPDDRPQTPNEVVIALSPFVGVAAPMPARPVAAEVNVEPIADEPNRALQFANDSVEQRMAGGSLGVKPKTTGTSSSLPLVLIGLAGAFVLAALATVLFFVFKSKTVGNAGAGDDDTSLIGNSFEPIPALQLVKIPSGRFDMGSPPGELGRQNNEGPVRNVTITRQFYMSVTEISREQYLNVVGAPAGSLPPNIGKSASRLPATNISWDDANEFCRKLNNKSSVKKPGWDFRLPTEAEWEYCARAGGDKPFGNRAALTQYTHGIFKLSPNDSYGEEHPDATLRRYNFETMPSTVVYGDKDHDNVYAREKNDFGLRDLQGNVWEWCADNFANYPDETEATDPTGPTERRSKVLRGGAYDSTAMDCRAAARRDEAPGQKAMNIGFRVVFAPKK